MKQTIFCAIDYGFKWTDDWYEWDRKEAIKHAKQQRNEALKHLRSLGVKCTPFSLGDQLVSKGGIGSGHPHIEEWSRAYGINHD
jgi:hypothetical protein